MKWYHYLICFTLIIAGVFCTIKLVDIFNVKSAEYGNAITIETKNDYNQISKFDFGTLTFTSNDQTNYQMLETYAPQDFDGTAGDYTILFNGEQTNNVVVTNGKISATYTVKFYDLNGNEIVQANVDILIEYLASGTKVTLTTTNTNKSVDYLYTYSNVTGAVVKVVERSK